MAPNAENKTIFRLTCIDLDSGEFALCINGHVIASADNSHDRLFMGELHEMLSRLPGVQTDMLRHRVPAMPYVRTFLRLLTGSDRLNATVARQIPGRHWKPKNRHSNLKQVEEALDTMIATGGEACPLPLNGDVQAEIFPEVRHTRTDRRLYRSSISTTRQLYRESREIISTGGFLSHGVLWVCYGCCEAEREKPRR